MNEELKKEVLKAKFYGFAPYQIAENTGLTIPEVNTIIKENKDYLNELGGRDYGNEERN